MGKISHSPSYRYPSSGANGESDLNPRITRIGKLVSDEVFSAMLPRDKH